MNWKHTQTSGIGLHDCRATQLDVNNDRMEFTFGEGVVVLADNENNPHSSHRKTTAASLVINNYDLESIYIFREVCLFGKRILTVRKSITPGKLSDMINSGKWQLEFITEYVSAFTVLYNCEIWSHRRPYHTECQIEMVYGSIEYNWNGIADSI